MSKRCLLILLAIFFVILLISLVSFLIIRANSSRNDSFDISRTTASNELVNRYLENNNIIIKYVVSAPAYYYDWLLPYMVDIPGKAVQIIEKDGSIEKSAMNHMHKHGYGYLLQDVQTLSLEDIMADLDNNDKVIYFLCSGAALKTHPRIFVGSHGIDEDPLIHDLISDKELIPKVDRVQYEPLLFNTTVLQSSIHDKIEQVRHVYRVDGSKPCILWAESDWGEVACPWLENPESLITQLVQLKEQFDFIIRINPVETRTKFTKALVDNGFVIHGEYLSILPAIMVADIVVGNYNCLVCCATHFPEKVLINLFPTHQSHYKQYIDFHGIDNVMSENNSTIIFHSHNIPEAISQSWDDKLQNNLQYRKLCDGRRHYSRYWHKDDTDEYATSRLIMTFVSKRLSLDISDLDMQFQQLTKRSVLIEHNSF